MTDETQSRIAPNVSRNSVRKRLLGAASLVRSRAFAAARQEIQAVLPVVQDDPEALVAAGILSFVTHDYEVSLAALARADAILPLAGITFQRFERANRLGWDREAIEVLEDAITRQPNEPTWHALLLAIRAKRQSYAQALKHGHAVLAEAPDIVPVRIEIAGIHAALGDARSTVLQLQRTVERAKRGPVFLEAARIARMVGAFPAAKAHLSQALTYADAAMHAYLGLGEIALWSGHLEEAEQLVANAEKIESSAAAKRISGIIAYLRGHYDSARKHLETAIQMDKNESEAFMWLAEIALREKRHDDAHSLISSAIATARGIVFSAYLLRLRVLLDYDEPAPAPPARHLTEHLQEALVALVPEITTPLADADIATASTILDRALERMHGNRSVVATYLRDGELKLVPGVRDPRTASRQMLERIQVDPPEMLLAEFDELAKTFPASGMPLVHKGELLLWLGRLEEARQMLEKSIDLVIGTRWAYIGLTLLETLEGNLEAALEVSARGVAVMNNTEGPAVFVHRGETLRLLGRDAEPDLVRAIKSNPSRVSAHLNLALVRLSQHRVEEARELVAQAIDVIPGIFSDAAYELELDQITDDLRQVQPDVLRRVVERALQMMRGNRSSTCITYVTRSGRIRFGRRMGATADPLHGRDDTDILLAARVLQQGLSALPARKRPTLTKEPSQGGAAEKTPEAMRSFRYEPTLRPEEIEFFIQNGYVRLEKCIPAEVIKRWVDDVTERLAKEAHRYARIGPALDPEKVPQHLDFEAPEAWPGRSVTVEGHEIIEVSQVMPRLWGAVCDLVGGEKKLATRRISNHVIFAVPTDSSLPPAPLELRDFHIDHPHSCSRFDSITNGVVVFALLSDVLPHGGATAILPESVPIVAKMIAARPDGPPVADLDWVANIAEKCSEKVFCAGKAGDVFLAHPLMVHCATYNQSKTFRWLSNPMFILEEPMDPMRPKVQELSPVERVIARALGRDV